MTRWSLALVVALCVNITTAEAQTTSVGGQIRCQGNHRRGQDPALLARRSGLPPHTPTDAQSYNPPSATHAWHSLLTESDHHGEQSVF